MKQCCCWPCCLITVLFKGSATPMFTTAKPVCLKAWVQSTHNLCIELNLWQNIFQHYNRSFLFSVCAELLVFLLYSRIFCWTSESSRENKSLFYYFTNIITSFMAASVFSSWITAMITEVCPWTVKLCHPVVPLLICSVKHFHLHSSTYVKAIWKSCVCIGFEWKRTELR